MTDDMGPVLADRVLTLELTLKDHMLQKERDLLTLREMLRENSECIHKLAHAMAARPSWFVTSLLTLMTTVIGVLATALTLTSR